MDFATLKNSRSSELTKLTAQLKKINTNENASSADDRSILM